MYFLGTWEAKVFPTTVPKANFKPLRNDLEQQLSQSMNETGSTHVKIKTFGKYKICVGYGSGEDFGFSRAQKYAIVRAIKSSNYT